MVWLYAEVGIGIDLSGGVRVSMWIVFFDDNIMIMLAAFIVCWVISVTQGTFCWCVPLFITIFAVM